MDFIPKKKLGFGLMRMPSLDPNDASKVDVEKMKEMVDLFIERGFTYFDTAWMYNNFASESAAKEFLTSRHPRESFTLSSKMHAGFFNSVEEREKMFEDQLRKTGAGYFDYYLLHGIERSSLPKYEEYDCFKWILEKKEAGLIRHAGFSYHDNAELLDEILTNHPEMEFVQLQINYLDWESKSIQSRACYDVCVKHNKPVIVMEPVKGGTLAKVPDEAKEVFDTYDKNASVSSWAIRFAASLPGVMVVLSGMSSIDQVKDNTEFMSDYKPLSEDEKKLCFKVADVINSQTAIPCTSCAYCTSGCPKSIAIPQYFYIYNEDMRERLDEKGWTTNYTNYQILAAKNGKPSDCVECGQCENVCPQHLTIIDYLKDVAKHYANF